MLISLLQYNYLQFSSFLKMKKKIFLIHYFYIAAIEKFYCILEEVHNINIYHKCP